MIKKQSGTQIEYQYLVGCRQIKMNMIKLEKRYKKGDKITILRKDIFHLKHRKNRNGVIKKIDGEYIYVRPTWCKWIIELYRNEIKPRK